MSYLRSVCGGLGIMTHRVRLKYPGINVPSIRSYVNNFNDKSTKTDRVKSARYEKNSFFCTRYVDVTYNNLDITLTMVYVIYICNH